MSDTLTPEGFRYAVDNAHDSILCNVALQADSDRKGVTANTCTWPIEFQDTAIELCNDRGKVTHA